jgi:6-pyruvoyltetrahydropterin/6-carboxytetrahydropterin synthase
MAKRLTTIELFKEDMKFSIGHFTIFSKESRENLHGHNYHLHACITTVVEDDLQFDYRVYKTKLRALCRSLDEITLLPGLSKHLVINDLGDYYSAVFNHEKMLFLKRDVKILPVNNISVEELSNWFVDQLILDADELRANQIQEIKIEVFSGPGQSASACWKNSDG